MAVVFVALAGVAGALAYSAWANEVEFDRLEMALCRHRLIAAGHEPFELDLVGPRRVRQRAGDSGHGDEHDGHQAAAHV